MNVHVLTTPAEAPWCNGIVERHNQVIGSMMEKLWEDGSRNLKQNLAWCLNSKNSMENNNGFTPYQLSIGINPTLPDNLNAKLPAFQGVTSSEVVAENLKTMNESRKIFTQLESSERLRRALRHNVRTYVERDVKPGDWVYFKRNDSERWRGKAKVMYVDGKTVHLKHGGRDVKVHLCRVIGVDDVENNQIEVDQTKLNDNPEHEDVSPLGDRTLVTGEHDSNETVVTQIEKQMPDVVADRVATLDLENEDAGRMSPTSFSGDTLPLNEKRVRYKLSGNDDWTMADVIGRGGKATGVNKNYINLQSGDDKYGIDWKKVEEWCPVQDEEALIAESSDHHSAKMSEIGRWVENKVFEAVEDKVGG